MKIQESFQLATVTVPEKFLPMVDLAIGLKLLLNYYSGNKFGRKFLNFQKWPPTRVHALPQTNASNAAWVLLLDSLFSQQTLER